MRVHSNVLTIAKFNNELKFELLEYTEYSAHPSVFGVLKFVEKRWNGFSRHPSCVVWNSECTMPSISVSQIPKSSINILSSNQRAS